MHDTLAMMDRISVTHRPMGRPVGFQRWRHLLFLHWEMPVAALQALVPPGLTIDTFEGRAYVGVLPFTMRDVSASFLPPVPGVRHFHELNVRTYVHHDRDPGVWFFSLDAANTLAVLAARAGAHLPYFRASMELAINGDRLYYRSHRRWPAPKPAELETSCRVGQSIGAAAPGSFEFFIAERYVLFADAGRGGLLRGQVHHRPYPLQNAEFIQLSESMVAAAGLPAPEGAPHVLYSAGVDVDIFRFERTVVTSIDDGTGETSTAVRDRPRASTTPLR